MFLKRYIEGLRFRIKNKKLRLKHCIQYADDTTNGDVIDCKQLEFKNFHDYKKYNPNRCNVEMIEYFIRGVGNRNKRKSAERLIVDIKQGQCESPYVFNREDSNKPIESGGEIFLK